MELEVVHLACLAAIAQNPAVREAAKERLEQLRAEDEQLDKLKRRERREAIAQAAE